MANQTDTRPRQASAVDRSAVLRKVMEVLSVKGFAKASIADLTKATGIDYHALNKIFGRRNEILRAAIRFCADAEASLAHEPLRVSQTGREAILAMLEENVRLRQHWPGNCGCLFTPNAFVVPPEDDELRGFLFEKRRSLSKHIRARLAQSVREGELPEEADSEILGSICLTLLSGLTFRVMDGTPPGLLFRSINLFVNSIGFRTRRRKATHMGRNQTPRRARNS